MLSKGKERQQSSLINRFIYDTVILLNFGERTNVDGLNTILFLDGQRRKMSNDLFVGC